MTKETRVTKMTDINILEEITKENKQLCNKIKLLEVAVKYYADSMNWTGKYNIARDDRGELARRTLEKGE